MVHNFISTSNYLKIKIKIPCASYIFPSCTLVLLLQWIFWYILIVGLPRLTKAINSSPFSKQTILMMVIFIIIFVSPYLRNTKKCRSHTCIYKYFSKTLKINGWTWLYLILMAFCWWMEIIAKQQLAFFFFFLPEKILEHLLNAILEILRL